MASSNQNSIGKLIICTICHELFDDPRVLSCSHTYCRKCIEETASTNKDQFECPFHDGLIISKNEIDTLPLNRIVRDLTEVYDSTQNPIHCSNCHSAVAEYGCDRCEDETFCSDCYQTVHTPRVMQKHQQIPANEKPSEMPFCSTHLDEKVKYWCTTCTTLVCTDCILLEHKNHQYNLIHKIAKELEMKITNDLNVIQSALQIKADQADLLIKDIDTTAALNRTKIGDIMACLRQTIDEHEQELLTQISTIEIEQKNQIEKYKSQWKYEPQNLSMQKAILKILLETKHYTKLLNISEGFDEYIERTNNILSTISMPTGIVYELKGFERLEIIKSEILQCGQCFTTKHSQSIKSTSNNEERQEPCVDPIIGPQIVLTGTLSNDFPNDMYLPKQQRQKRLCRK